MAKPGGSVAREPASDADDVQAFAVRQRQVKRDAQLLADMLRFALVRERLDEVGTAFEWMRLKYAMYLLHGAQGPALWSIE